ncbi:hypothetical protein WA026_011821 [Henosepilachna vigintioctopunctata]|uniref:Peroxisomal membrane protein 11B n=1 Tax=Henosepilachna vigintioctopunctata TaxID=420089 RepID=A0AAW1UIC9_9CUCU
METIIRINNQTAGRDKTARLIQYLSKFAWYTLQKNNSNIVEILKNLEYQLGTFRKLLRIGRCADVLHSGLALLRHKDPIVNSVVVYSKIASSLYLLADHFLWLGRSEICDVNMTKWAKLSNKAWLYSIIMNIIRDIYELQKILKLHFLASVQNEDIKHIGHVKNLIWHLLAVLYSRKEVTIDIIKNSCDFFLPYTYLGGTNLSPGTIGILGTISSVAGLLVLIYPSCKLENS